MHSDEPIFVLLIGPSASPRCPLRDILIPPRWETSETCTYGRATDILESRDVGVAICDTEIDGGHWQLLLETLQRRANPPNVIVSSRLADERLWSEVLNLGGYDVLVQPFDPAEVLRISGMAWMAWRRRMYGGLRMGAAS